MRLYIIGNGFDIAHGLKTGYWNFREFLERRDERFLFSFENLYGFRPIDFDDYHISNPEKTMECREKALKDILWKDFENALGYPAEYELDSICDSAISEMDLLESGPVEIEDTLNYYFEEQFKFIEKIHDYLKEWVEQISLDKIQTMNKYIINDRKDYFLTFNYTPVLEKIYGIKSEQICHIHGGLEPYCRTGPILGHGNIDAIQLRRKWIEESEREFDEGSVSKNKEFEKFYKRLFKDTNMSLFRNNEFFRKIEGIDEVYVVGHSLGKVDMPYFKMVTSMTGTTIPWKVYYHSAFDLNNFQKSLDELEIRNFLFENSETFWDTKS